MSTRTVFIPAVNKRVTLKAYIQAVKTAKANPATTFKHGLTCWYACKGEDIVNQFFEGVQHRINQAIPYNQRGI